MTKNFLKQLWGRKVRRPGIYRGRRFTKDVALQFRMGAGFLGDVNRTHPFTAEPALISVTNPPRAYGEGMVVDAADPNRGLRPLVAADNALTTIYGISIRPFPFQVSSIVGSLAQSNLDVAGPNVPPSSGPIDILRSGYIMVKLNSASAQPVKGGAVFIWVAATSGNHIQGGFEAAANGANTLALTTAGQTTFNGPSDSNFIVELIFNI